MIFRGEDARMIKVQEGTERKVFAQGGSMMLTQISVKKGIEGPVHSHIHEQISYILSGSIELTIGDEKQILKAGDSYYTEPNLKHGALALEDTVMLEMFTPQREEFQI